MANTKLINIDLLAKFKAKQDTLNAATYITKTDYSNIYRFKGTVATYADLPADASTGDVYNITAADAANNIKAGDNVAFTEDKTWDNLSGTVDLSNYVEKDGAKVLSTNDYTDADKAKVDAASSVSVIADLTAGDKIATIIIDGTATDIYATAKDIATEANIDALF